VHKLAGYHNSLLQLLDKQGIHPMSSASNGTEVERSMQSLLLASTPSTTTLEIKSTMLGASISICVPLIHSCPLVMVQDPNHSSKTSRNNLFSGAQCLTLGNHCMMHFGQMMDLADDP
jgi:hypothetical protein